MQKLTLAVAATIITGVTVALAHENETNPVILARMEAMKTIGAQTKALGEMAKGATPFDAAAAQAAAAKMAAEAEKVPALFEAEETSATSEALPAIWQNFPDFTHKAEALTRAATDATGIAAESDLGPALAAIGQACKSCHSDYRVEK